MDIIITLGPTHFPQILRRYIARRLHSALGHFGVRVGRLDVRVLGKSISAGDYARCQIGVQVLPSGSVYVDEAASDLYLAIDSATAAATHAFADELRRIRQLEARTQAVIQ